MARGNDATETEINVRNHAIGSQVFDFLVKQNLPPTPANYELGYLRATDDNGFVARAVDAILISGRRVSELEADQIVEAWRALEGPPANAKRNGTDQEGQRLKHQALHLADLAADTIDSTGRFGNDLSSGLLALGSHQAPIADIVAAMIRRTSEVENELKVARTKIDALNAEITSARDDASRDALTGLLNRRGLADKLAGLGGQDVNALAVCDIDNFKAINDGHGHLVGDRVLQAVALDLVETCHPHLVGRWGGEEFVVVMEGVGLCDAETIICSANEHLQSRRFRVQETGAFLGTITFSAGLVSIEASEADEAIAAADMLMYQAKASGRNRVVRQE